MDRVPFASCILKLNRAEDHLHALQDEIDRFLNSEVYDAIPERDRKGRAVVRVRNLRQPPKTIPLLIGEFLYNARSGLDHAAYDLTELKSGTPLADNLAKSSAFPIFNSGADYRDRKKNGDPTRKSGLFKVDGMSRNARATIERLQPYHRRKNPRTKLLWILEELANVDKHRLLPVTAMALRGTQYRLGVTGGPFTLHQIETFVRPLKDNAMVARFTVDLGPEGHMHVDANTVLDVVFDKGIEAKSARGLGVVATLNEISDFIANEVMPALADCVPDLRYAVTEGPPPPRIVA